MKTLADVLREGTTPGGAVTANPRQMRLADVNRSAYQRNPVEGASGALNFGAGLLGVVPGVGDAIGFANDVNQMRINPEQRTPFNIGMAALGLLPFVPSGSQRLMAKAGDAAGSAPPAAAGTATAAPAMTAEERSSALVKALRADPSVFKFGGAYSVPAQLKGLEDATPLAIVGTDLKNRGIIDDFSLIETIAHRREGQPKAWQLDVEYINKDGKPDAGPALLQIGSAAKGAPIFEFNDARNVARGLGQSAYQSLGAWANAANTRIPQDFSVSEINQLRKLGNVLSAQARFDKPLFENVGSLKGTPSTGAMLEAESQLARQRVPALSRLTFDGANFKIGNKRATDDEIMLLVQRADPKAQSGVGLMTAKRAALQRWAQTNDPTKIDTKRLGKIFAGGAAGAVGLGLMGDQAESD